MLWFSFALAIPATDTAVPFDGDGDGFPEFDDCDDADASVYPTALELCDGKDNDCDGQVDEGVPIGAYVVYADNDGDGHGSQIPTTLEISEPTACPVLDGYSNNPADCDDDDPEIHPGAPDDSCNGIDEDCDGYTDDGHPDARPYYLDPDRDGYGWAWDFGCPPTDQPVTDRSGDCDQTDPSIHSGAEEIMGDGIDQDCDGMDLPWTDADGDGVDIRTDCDDTSSAVFPGATETCGNRVDDDCNGEVDDGCPDEPHAEAPKGCNQSVGMGRLPLWGWLRR